MLVPLLMVVVVLMTRKVVVSELRVVVRGREVARVLLTVEPEPDGRRIVVMVVLIRRGILRERTVLGTLGI